MPFDTFKKALKDTSSPEHGAMLKHVLDLVSISRKQMAQCYTQWDKHDETFRSRRKTDKEDRAADSKGQPKKLVVPLTFSQCMTFVAFNVMTLTQNKRFYTLEPTGVEDNPLREPMELILERDLRKNTWQAFLIQFFLDIARFSIGCAEVCYKEDYRFMRMEKTEDIVGAFGETTQETSMPFEKVPVFVGNRVIPISPYRFFPDTRLPLTRYQEGEFCGSEDIYSMASLKGDTELFNLTKIPKYLEKEYAVRKVNSRIVEMDVRMERDSSTAGSVSEPGGMVKSGPVCVTKMVCDIIPKNFGGDNKELGRLGTEPFPIRYLVWIANDKTIIRFEEAYYLHCKFPYILSQFLPDQHQIINESLADVCAQLTSLITWKLNAHITSQKNSVESKWIVDPAGIDVKSLESRSPYIYLRKNASQTGVDRYIKQFSTQDVTAGVMNDTAALKELLEGITGYSGMLQGQFSSGRRDATQSRAVVQGASARGKTTLGGIWDTGFEMLGKQLIANNRQEMDFETFSRVLGTQWKSTSVNPETGATFTLDEMFTLFKADPITIATSEDFFVFDGSNPSENAFLAQSMQEILLSIMQNPEVAQILGYGAPQIQALFNEIYTLRGVTPARLPTPTPMQPPQPGLPPEGAAQPAM